jgi:hypothetical protein
MKNDCRDFEGPLLVVVGNMDAFGVEVVANER